MVKDDGKIGITFWGVRGSTPCANKENMKFGGNTTCVQIQVPNTEEVLILDSGTGIRNLGNHLIKKNSTVEGHIFLTHPHWDHIQGFPFFKPIYNPDNHFGIHLPEQINGGCKEILAGHLTKTFFPITLDMLNAGIEYITQPPDRKSYGAYEVEFMPANHPISTAIYKIHVEDKQIVFCPDNELTPASERTDSYFYQKLKNFIKGADVLIHDAQYDRKRYRNRVGWGHSAWEETVELAIGSGVERLYLTHHDPDSDDEYLSLLNEKVQKHYSSYFKTVQLAREGESIFL